MPPVSGAVVFDGRKVASEKEKVLQNRIAQLNYRPKLAAILIGDDPASKIFLRLKKEAAERVGIKFELIHNLDSIEKLNQDPTVTGIMVQLPIPDGYKIDNLIVLEKDVDCLTSENLKLLAQGKPRYFPAVIKAILQTIQLSNHLISNSRIGVVGHGILVGQPLVSYLQSQKVNLTDQIKMADILIVATGKEKLITGQMVKPGAVVIDCGSPLPEVDFESVKQVASFITPVPGGLGPLTVVSLLNKLRYIFDIDD